MWEGGQLQGFKAEQHHMVFHPGNNNSTPSLGMCCPGEIIGEIVMPVATLLAELQVVIHPRAGLPITRRRARGELGRAAVGRTNLREAAQDGRTVHLWLSKHHHRLSIHCYTPSIPGTSRHTSLDSPSLDLDADHHCSTWDESSNVSKNQCFLKCQMFARPVLLVKKTTMMMR